MRSTTRIHYHLCVLSAHYYFTAEIFQMNLVSKNVPFLLFEKHFHQNLFPYFCLLVESSREAD